MSDATNADVERVRHTLAAILDETGPGDEECAARADLEAFERIVTRAGSGIEPIRVDQRPNGCWFACLATLTGIPLDALPQLPPDASDEWFEQNRARLNNETHPILRERGWFMVHLWKNVPHGFAIAGGTSPRGIPHSVVVLDGELWHDPHPSRAGLVEVEIYEVPMRIVDERRRTLTAGSASKGEPHDAPVCPRCGGHPLHLRDGAQALCPGGRDV